MVLWRVGRNLNRAVRTCASFGVRRLRLVQCVGSLRGNLYSARDTVAVERARALTPLDLEGACALETWGSRLLSEVDWERVGLFVIGGESHDVPRLAWPQTAKIDGAGGLCLTVEAALAIALYAWRISCC